MTNNFSTDSHGLPAEQLAIKEAVEAERNLNDIYWLDVIAKLADGVAGIAEGSALRKSTARYERVTQADVCKLFAETLEGVPLKNRTVRPEQVAKRLRGVEKILREQACEVKK